MSVTYDTLLGDSQTIQYVTGASNTNLYPDSNTIAIAGPIWLPRIYGKDLTAFEIASSGKIAISLNDIHTLDVQRTTYVDDSNFKNTIVSQSNYSFELSANNNDLFIMMDAYSNNIKVSAASNVAISANSGNMNLTASNNLQMSVSNNFSLAAQSNVTINAASGSANLYAHKSNMYLTMTDSTNTVTVYSSNETYVSACNNLYLNTNSNIGIGAKGGDIWVTADDSNMRLSMEMATRDVTVYTVSNLNLVSSNDTSITSSSNISLGALSGGFQAYANGSNMYLTMDSTTDNVSLFGSNNVAVGASNNFTLNAQSNVLLGALAGDFKTYANGSNMYLTMASATNNVDMFASNNLAVAVSNSLTMGVNSNVSVSTKAGDYRLYVNSSNMFLRMSSTTNNVNLFSSNSTVMSASNNFNVYALSNMSVTTSNGSISLSANSSNMYVSLDSTGNDVTVFASNNMGLTASNDFAVNAQSNVNIGALAGDFNAYADASNMYLTMARATDNVTLYGASNVYISGSNSLNLNANSNLLLGSKAGDVKLAANNSNMTFTMAAATNSVSLFSSNNLTVSVSNSIATYAKSNVSLSTIGGDVKVYANSSNMYLVMDHTSNDVSLYASNNYNISVSNDLTTTVNSNVNIGTIAGSFNVAANSSNMYLFMDAATNDVSLFSSNNTSVSASNNLNVWTNSNVSVSTTAGSFDLSVNSSNMLLSMDAATNDTFLFTSNDFQVSVSNNAYVNVQSNLLIGALSGDFKVYSQASNMFLTMNSATNVLTVFASNDMSLGTSNTLRVNAQSNIYVGAKAGDLKLYATASNMFLTMATATNDVSLFASNNYTVSTSNNFSSYTQSNVLVAANRGDLKLTANSSNMSLTMDHTSNNVTVYASNNVYVNTSNSYELTTLSNVSLSATNGSVQVNAALSNMYLIMDATTNDTTVFSSNNLSMGISNDLLVNVQSNVLVGALAGDVKVYSMESNMYLTMDSTTNTITEFASNNFAVVASNTATLNAKSNVLVGALSGDFKAYADASNMYLTMAKATDNVTLYAASNVFLSASNNFNINSRSNFSVGALAGSASVYANGSNMFLTMNAATNTQTLYTLNQMNLTASNGFALNAQSNVSITSIVGDVSVSASNDVIVSASNNYTMIANSNIEVSSVAGSLNMYVNNSNMFIQLDSTTNNVNVFASNDINVGVSNDLHIYVHSNIIMAANEGAYFMYANHSNMFILMDDDTNNTDIYASNNLNISTSNSAKLSTISNVSISADTGSVKLYAATSNMLLTMNADNLNTTLYTSNTMYVGASNSFNLNANSNIAMGALAGSLQAYADSSNMYLTMTKSTDAVTVYTVSNMFLSASNILNANAKSNILIGALAGDLKAYADSSNMYLTMTKATDDVTLYTASNFYAVASNEVYVSAKSNVLLGALAGDLNAYADSSNMYLTMTKSTDSVTLYTVSNIYAVASNDVNATAHSNILLGALSGDFKTYADSSNMSLVMSKATDTVSLYTLSNVALVASNAMSITAKNDITIGSLVGSVKAYSDGSNVSVVLDKPTDSLVVYALSNVDITACNNLNASAGASAYLDAIVNFEVTVGSDTIVSAQSNVLLGALAGDAKVYADASNLALILDHTLDDATLYASSNVFLSASNNMNINGASNVLIDATAGDFKAYANASNMFLTMAQATDNVVLYSVSNIAQVASNNFAVNAKSNINVGALAGSLKLYANSSNMFLTMDQATNTLNTYTTNQLNLTASNSFALNAQSNVQINAIVNNITMYASNDFTSTASNSFTVTARSNVLLNASKGSFSTYANDSNMFLTLDQATNDASLYAMNNVQVAASNNLTVGAHSNVSFNALNGDLLAYANSNLKLTADASNMYINMNAVGDVISMYSKSNVLLTASNNMFLEATSNISIIASNIDILVHRNISIVASNNITISGSNGVTLNFANVNIATSNDQQFHAQSNIEFFVDASSNASSEPVFVVSGDQILVRGDIVVTGNINTSNIFSTTVIQESLKVADKEMTLASIGSNFDPVDGPFDGVPNSGAGIRVDGVPLGFDSNIPEAYDKTFNWNYGNTGIAGLGSEAGLSNNESYWEVKGGSFRMTHQKIVAAGGSNIIQDISFTMRVNEFDELEFVKVVNSNNSTTFKRIARFGRIM